MRVYAQFKGCVTRLSYDLNGKQATSQAIENALVTAMQKRTCVKKSTRGKAK
jgi:hypothetical protein